MRTARETLTYSICLFQIQLRTVAGLTPHACAASLTVSIFAICVPRCTTSGEILPSAMLYVQRMIFVEHYGAGCFSLSTNNMGIRHYCRTLVSRRTACNRQAADR